MKTDFIYNIVMPANQIEGKKYPVIYVLHGRGGNETDMVALLEECRDEFIVIGIRGTLLLGNGFEYFSIKGFGNPDVESLDQAMKRLTDFINECKDSYPIDEKQQFLLGFSQGAILSMSLALTMGEEKIKGIVAMSGYIPQHIKQTYTMQPINELKVFIHHGEFDPIFPVSIGEENYQYFLGKAKDLEYKVHPIGHQIAKEEKKDIILWLKKRISSIQE